MNNRPWVKLCLLVGVCLMAFTRMSCKTTKRKDADPPPTTELPSDVRSGFAIADDGTKIHYLVTGRGTPVLLIHGYYADGESNWFRNGLAQELAKTNLVVAIDNRGHGKSDKPHDVISYGGLMWQDAWRVLKHLKIDKAHIHGYSMGGSIMAQLLYHHPEAFISATFGGSGIPDFSKADSEKAASDAQGSDPEEPKAKAVLMSTLTHDIEAMKAVAKNAPWDGTELKQINLSNVKIPVLAINGEFDSPVAKTQRLKAELPNFQNVILKGKSHLTAITPGYMPDLYRTTLVDFIRKNDQ